MKKRLSKALAAAGVASRRHCEEIIFKGKVTINGAVTFMPQKLVDWSKDVILVDGKPVRGEENKVYFLLNKPVGYLCTSVKKKGGAKLALDLFSHLTQRLFTVGRLDQETSGLIIVTNDGEFANRVIHPSFGVSKEYLAKTNQEITAEHLATLSAGMRIQGVLVKPLEVTKVRRGTLKIVIAEGKKHEVRELLGNAGLTIRELTRIRIGSLTLSNLVQGTYRALTIQEIDSFLNNPEN